MIQADFILCATVGDKKHFFEYECKSIFQALEEFWHEDYPEMMRHLGDCFPIDSYYLCGSGVEKERHLMFNTAVFHAFFDHGHKADGPYTEEDFLKDIERTVKPDPKQMKALMDRWAHFCYSHPPYDEVILWMVGGSKQHYLYQHFCSKFNHLCNVCHDDTMSAWIKFYRELDDQWAERLMQYVYCECKK